MAHRYYRRRAGQILAQFDRVAHCLRPLLAARYGEAAAFVPYVCLYDFPKSRLVSGCGLVRTTTLAEGGERCDMRFKRGGPTINRQKTRLGPGPDGRVPPEEDTQRILL